MIISHQFRFIFIKNTKVAGTSIEIFLSSRCPASDVFTPIYPEVEQHQARNYEAGAFFNHMKGSDIKARVSPEIWDSYFKFCVERNPWDKTLSYYHMENFRAGGQLSLDDYLEHGDLPVNFPKYTDHQGKIIVDRVLRYEQLEQDLGEVFTQLGVPFGGSLDVFAKSGYRSDRRPYREVLTPEQAEFISVRFAREIELLGYRY